MARKLEELTKLCDDKSEEFKQLEHQDTKTREDSLYTHSQSKKLQKTLAQEQKKVGFEIHFWWPSVTYARFVFVHIIDAVVKHLDNNSECFTPADTVELLLNSEAKALLSGASDKLGK